MSHLSLTHRDAVLALDTLAPGVDRAAPEFGEMVEPDEAREALYRERYRRFLEMYQRMFGER